MITFRPLFWTVVALLLAIVQPVISYPIRTSEWVKTREVNDANTWGVWKVYEKERSHSSSESAQAILKSVSLSCIPCSSSNKLIYVVLYEANKWQQ